ncbi:J domain-containing protein [Marinomonas posidonica]|uniref:Heat shock protein DnaJ domain protein n=1 Tax=Marinomonas posidonica (strain CECT 7376 / NCIMB 14433 / IVIA-Po-181) TaxID=491952 RepID=F6CRU2_MARPP|nr:J domain-containing protein [Marinomonas posidonica]AEF54945.1 heat shock protein DnaJ domain protein [Marinomonas posidonica IVIA-Po-181]
MSLLDDYQLLEIPTNASEQEAKSAFRRLARKYHPDKNPETDTTEHFQRLQAAYENVQNAIRQGAQTADWKPFSFTQPDPFHTAGFRHSNQSNNASDKAQEAFIRERQRAYEEMKRNNAHQEKTRNEAIKAARNTLNEKRIKALYEEAFKASENFTSDGYKGSSSQQTNYDIPPYQSFIDDEMEQSTEDRPKVHAVKLDAAKAAFRAATYIACFAAGIYATLYWQDQNALTEMDTPNPRYVAGLYPQFRIGTNYTLQASSLYAEPDSTSKVLEDIPAQVDVQVFKQQGDWLTIRYQNKNGWLPAQSTGFGSIRNARKTGCFGYPGIAPDHGELIGSAQGNSRLRILNQLPSQSLLTFQSFDGKPPFSIYLNKKQAFAANFIPRGQYRLVLETGSLYHHACQQFLFNDKKRIILDNVDFASTEQTLTLSNL